MSLALLLAVYLFAIVYGSLIPFAFEPRSFDDATALLRQSPPPPSAVLGNPDFGLNVALYIPLGFLIAATIGTRCRLLTPPAPSYLSRALVVTSALAASLAVSLAMEIAQGYTTARSADLGDVLANGLGGLIGAALVGLSTHTVLHGLGLLGAGGRGATKPVSALGIIAFVLFSFFPFDFVKDTAHLYAKIESGLIAPFLAPAYCRGVAPCAARLALESVFAALLALLLAVWLPLKTRLAHWAAAGAAVGLGVEFAQVFLASGIAQGASIATRALGFLLVGWCVDALKRSGLDFIRLHASLVAPGLFACAALAIVAVNRIHPPFAWPPEPALTVLGSVNWVPFGYLFEVTEARIAQSVMAQFAAFSLLGTAFWVNSFGSRRFAVVRGVVTAMLIAAVVEGAKLFMPGRHPDPTDILIAGLACGIVFALLSSMFPTSAQATTLTARDIPNPTPGTSARLATSSSDSTPRLPKAGFAPARTSLAVRTMALVLLAVAMLTAISLPRFGGAVAIVALVAAGATALRRDAWLIVLPLLLPLFDLTHWTGRFYWTEFDVVCAATLATLWWRYGLDAGTRWTRLPAGLTLLALGIWTLAGAVASGWPFPAPMRANLDSYFSPFVGFYSAKGIGWALLFYPFAALAMAENEGRARQLFVTGMASGLATSSAFILWERHSFPGLFNLAHEYRVTGPFSAMHVGGAYVEGYLIGALPFAACLAIRFGPSVRGLASMALLAGATYALLVTHSRGAYLALVAASAAFVLPLGLAMLRGKRGRLGHAIAGLVVVGALATGVIALGRGETMQQRFATVLADGQTRIDHWARSLRMVETRAAGWAVGIGPGQFASTYFWRPDAIDVPSRIIYGSDDQDTFVRMGSGATTFVSQFVDVVSDSRYVFNARVRASRTPAEFSFPLCEKWLLDSFGCVWTTVTIEGAPGQWTSVHRELNTQELQYAKALTGRPVKLSLFNPNPSTFIDITAVSLRDSIGRELVGNGSFSAGPDRWIFTTDSHLAWHAKNLPIHVLVELGAIGLLLFFAVMVRSMLTTGRHALEGDVFAATLLASVVGMLTVGLTDSLIDAPRLATMLFLLVEIGVLLGWSPSRRMITAGTP